MGKTTKSDVVFYTFVFGSAGAAVLAYLFSDQIMNAMGLSKESYRRGIHAIPYREAPSGAGNQGPFYM